MNPQLCISIHNVGIDYITKYNFKRVQLCHKFSGANEITSLLKLSRRFPIKISYHAPVFHQVDPTITYYLNSNSRLRKATFEILEVNLKMAKSLPTEHVVIHFACKDIDGKADPKLVTELAKDSIEKINNLSIKYCIPIYLEYSGYNDKFYKPDDWINLIKNYPKLGICLDIGHFYIACQMYGFDYFEELNKMLPYIKVMDVWNTKGIEDLEKYGHIPVHPEQTVQDGWIDVERTLREVLLYNSNICIGLEPYIDYKGKEYVQQGIEWVNRIVNSMTTVKKSQRTVL